MRRIGFILVTLGVSCAGVFADDTHTDHAARPDSHAPIGVMGDHAHKAGGWMFSYRYIRMEMEDMRDGTDDLSAADIFNRGYVVAPTKMSMDMHMFGLMVAPTDTVTLMIMAPYVLKEMDHLTQAGSPARTQMGRTFTKNTEAWGDTTVAMLPKVWAGDGQQVHLNLGLSLPTGSIDQRDPEPLAYPMQTGSGTWDLKPGATYLGKTDAASWGAQALGTIRLGRNDADYSFGDEFESSAWAAWPCLEWASVSGRIRYQHIGRVDGDDDRVTARLSPPQDPDHTGGDYIEAGAGMNLLGTRASIKGHRLAVEALWPVYQDLNGPQHKRDVTYTVGWQKAW